jgi:hypothetical protein
LNSRPQILNYLPSYKAIKLCDLSVYTYNNTFVGYSAGSTNTTGFTNTFVGAGADANGVGYSNASAFGASAITTGNKTIVIGPNTTGMSIGGYAGWSNFSDSRWKTNVKNQSNGLSFIMKLRPVNYLIDYQGLNEFLSKNMVDSIKRARNKMLDFSGGEVQIGFIAQEVENVAKETGYIFDGVKKPRNENDHYGLIYAQFVVPLVESVQMQQKMIDSLKAAIIKQDSLIKSFPITSLSQQSVSNNEKGLNRSGSAMNLPSDNSTPILYDNVPNPFTEKTSIEYLIPTTSQSASLMIFDLQGKPVKTIAITKFGNNAITINGNELTPGMFIYSLVVDGKIIDTKRMILTEQ